MIINNLCGDWGGVRFDTKIIKVRELYISVMICGILCFTGHRSVAYRGSTHWGGGGGPSGQVCVCVCVCVHRTWCRFVFTIVGDDRCEGAKRPSGGRVWEGAYPLPR